MEKKIGFYFFHLVALAILPNISSQSLYSAATKIPSLVSRHSPFEEITKSPYFVDKTDLIEYLQRSWMTRKYLHLCKPKKFGKSIILDMVKRFYEINVDATTGQRVRNATTTENYKLFKNQTLNLTISRRNTFRQYFGQYVVVYLNFSAPISLKSYENVVEFVKMRLIDVFKSMAWVLESSPHIDRSDKKLLSNVLNMNTTANEMIHSLRIFSKTLRNYFEKPVILLVDEIDSPIDEALKQGLNAKRVNDEIIAPLILNALKQGDGILKYSLLTGTNCILADCLLEYVRTVPFLDDQFSEYCGFTVQEANTLFEKNRINDAKLRKEVINFYNGYKAVSMNLRLVNPWSLISYFSQENLDRPLPHWPANYTFPKLSACFANGNLKNVFFKLILNQRINFQLTKIFDSDDLEVLENFFKDKDCAISEDENAVKGLYLSYLFVNGYLTYADSEITFRLPNREINYEFAMNYKYFYNDYFTVQESMDVIKSLELIMVSAIVPQTEIVRLQTNLMKLFKIGFSNINKNHDLAIRELQFHALLYTEILFLGLFREVSANRKDYETDTNRKRNDVTIFDSIRNCILIIQLEMYIDTVASTANGGKKEPLQLLADYRSSYENTNYVDGMYLKFLYISIHSEKSTMILMGPCFIFFKESNWTVVGNDANDFFNNLPG